MLLAFCFVVATAALCFGLFHSKRSIARVLKEIRYEGHFQIVGVAAVVEDYVQRKRNKLEALPDKAGHVAVVTGGARGIGVEVVKTLVRCGARVVLGVRSPAAGLKLARDCEDEGLSGSVEVHELDVSSLKSVEKFAAEVCEKHPAIDLLVNNAGVMFGDYKLSEDGFEYQLATNYLGHFYLTHFLLPNMKAAGEKGGISPRVVNVTSCAHYPAEIFFDDINMKLGYITSAAYAQSKLAQLMSARYLDNVFQSEGTKVRCYSVHPGVVNTDLFDKSPMGKYAPWVQRSFFKSPMQGAVSILHACFSPKLESRGGLYISNCRQGVSNLYSKNEDAQKKLFDYTCDMLKIKNFGVPREC